MMLSTVVLALQFAAPIADQTWKFDVGVSGSVDAPKPIGTIQNPLATGELTFATQRPTTPGLEPFTLSMKLKRKQSDLIEALSMQIPDSPIGPKNDKDFVYFTHQYWFKPATVSIEHKENATFDQPAQLLNPFALGVGIMQRAMAGPELKKEYFLMVDAGRKFYGVFNINLNANIDPSKGEMAYKFNIVLKENKNEYPKFFTGAVRGNTKTKKIDYIKATSNPNDGPMDMGETSYPDVKSFAFNLVAK